MESSDTDKPIVCISARDHVDSEGSVVRSGVALAERVLQELDAHPVVQVDLHGIMGASTSYFNVFLRRIDEACGLHALESRVRLRFASGVQEMVFKRSYDSMRRGARMPNPIDVGMADSKSDPHVDGLLRRLVMLIKKAF